MEDLQKDVNAVKTVKTDKKETGVVKTNKIEKQFTQTDIDGIVNKRLARAKREWEKTTQTKKGNEEVKDLQIKVAKYERDLALSKYQVEDDFVDYVKFKVLRNVNKDKSYAQAVEEFFSNEGNKKYLKSGAMRMPRPQNIGMSNQDPIQSKYGNVKPLNRGKI